MADSNTNTRPAVAIGEVQAVSGRAVAIGPGGAERQLVAGDTVYEGELIRTLGASTIVVNLRDGTRFDLGREAEALLDETLLGEDIEALRAAALAEAAELQAAIAAGADPTEIADATAAGGEPGSAADESIQSGVNVERTARVGSVEAGYDTSAPADGNGPLLTDAIDYGNLALAGLAAGGGAAAPNAILTINPPGLITPALAAGTIAITGSVSGSYVAGDTVTLSIGGVDYTGPVAADGSFSIGVPGSALTGDADHVIEGSVTVSNALGDTFTATDGEGYAVGTPVAAAEQYLAAEFYQYNDRKVPASGWDKHADDRSIGNLDNLAEIRTLIDNRSGAAVTGTVAAGAADVTFESTRVDYGQIKGHLGRDDNLQRFLRHDGGSLSLDPNDATDSIIRIIGYIMIDATNMDFRVRSDDGFMIRIGDTEFGLPTNHSPRTDQFNAVDLEPGLQEIEIIYWDQGGNAVLSIDARETGTTTWEDLGNGAFDLFNPAFVDGLADNQQIIADPDNPGEYLVVTGAELTGGSDADNLSGTDYADILVGGAGEDILTGGDGADTFAWQAGDQGAAGTPVTDTVTDFSLAEGDALNLADLLVDEVSHPLADYLSFELSPDGMSTLVHVSSDGGFAGGYSAAAEDQTIVLQNVNLTTLGATDQLIIDALINGNHLVVDS